MFYRSDGFFSPPPILAVMMGKVPGLLSAAAAAQGMPPVCPDLAPARTGRVSGTESSLLKYLTKPYGALHVRGRSVR